MKYVEVKEIAKQVDPQMAMKDELFDEVSILNTLIKKIPKNEFCRDEAETKWIKIFTRNASYTVLHKLISIIFFSSGQ